MEKIMNLYNQALNTYKAIHGTEPEHLPYKDASHAPFRGIDPEIVKELIDEKEVTKFLREWKKENKPEEIDLSQPINDFVPIRTRKRSLLLIPGTRYLQCFDIMSYHKKVSVPNHKFKNFIFTERDISPVNEQSLKERIFLPSEKDLVDHYFYPKKGVMDIFNRDYFKKDETSTPTLFFRGIGITKIYYHSLLKKNPCMDGFILINLGENEQGRTISTNCLIGEVSTDAKSI
jgi:hypothetical protein